jgi:competence protein ComEA
MSPAAPPLPTPPLPAPPLPAPPPAGEADPRAPRVSGPSRTPSVVTRLRTTLSSRAILDPGRRGVAALAVVAVLACVLAGWSAWRARPRPEPVHAVRVAAGAPPLPGTTVAVSSPPAELVVAVGGGVRRPGLVRLPSGARVADAVGAAGGITPGTDTTGLNLARKVVDGELITVGPAAAAGAGPAPGAPGGAGGLVNLNTATAAELDTLPGVGPVLAQRILDHRQQSGGFRSVDQLRDVDGIGEARFAELRYRVTV